MDGKRFVVRTLVVTGLGILAIIALPLLLDRAAILPDSLDPNYGVFFVAAGVPFLMGYTIPRLTWHRARNKTPTHERIRASREWLSPQGHHEALRRIRAEFEDGGRVVAQDEWSLKLAFGSDLAMRSGAPMKRWPELIPVLLTVTVTPADTVTPAEGGCRVSAESRDDLRERKIPIENLIRSDAVAKNTELLDRAMTASAGTPIPRTPPRQGPWEPTDDRSTT